ncbi:MAG TPA: ester cyclase [Steroidobacteraceae bacterium]|nr:ester cyclase [Steroidobacteraceae bacterium]
MRRLALLLLALSVVISAPVTADEVEARNKAVARSFFEDVLDKGKLEDYAKSHAPDFVANSEGRKASLEEDMAAAREQRKALPDMRVKVNQIVAEGDLVSVYWTASGTNTAASWGIPATGKSVTASGMTLFRFERGLIQEEWSVFNMYSILKQLGLLTPPGA